MTGINPVEFALFDVDGLLLDTEIIYTEVTQQIVNRFGKTFDWSIKANMLGRAAIDSARYLVEALDLPIPAEQYLDERNSLLRERFAGSGELPGAQTLVKHLHQHKVPIAVATSSSYELFEIKKTRHGHWFDLFDTVVSGDHPEVRQAKPAPDIFNVAARNLGADPAHTLIFEDAPSGLAAGLAAGMRVIVVPDPNMDRSRYQGAEEMLSSLDQFDPVRYGLPAY
jgi:pseudouridine-5'-monophosphatase